MSEDKKAFRYIGGQAWVEMREPNFHPHEFVPGDWNYQYWFGEWDKYNNRLHYDVQPKPKEWEEGRLIIEGVDFRLKYPVECLGNKRDGGCKLNLETGKCDCGESKAIPITTMKEERKFNIIASDYVITGGHSSKGEERKLLTETKVDRFEAAIRDFGIDAALEYFEVPDYKWDKFKIEIQH